MSEHAHEHGPDLGEHVGKAGGKAKEFLTHQIGPLPVWAWLGAVAGGLVLYKWRAAHAAAGSAATATDGTTAATDTTGTTDTGLGLGGNTTTQPGAGNLYNPYDNGAGLGATVPDGGAGAAQTPVTVIVEPAQPIDNGGPTSPAHKAAHKAAPGQHHTPHPAGHPATGGHRPHPAQGAQSAHPPAPKPHHPAHHAAQAVAAAPAHHEAAHHEPAKHETAHPATGGHEPAHHSNRRH